MPDKIIISIDAMGGDNAPDVILSGIDHYIKHKPSSHVEFLLHGDEQLITPLMEKFNALKARSVIRHTSSAIDMGAKPSQALRRGKGTSMWNTVEAVKTQKATVGLSAGNTGAFMAISNLQLRTKTGVQRPALAALWPRSQGMSVVLDVGANVECDASQLTEFAVMGQSYYRALFGVKQPRVGLLNVGTEDNKGHAVIKSAHTRLLESKIGLNYIGYVEGNDISCGDVDVVVTDGFTGNIALKTAEGTAKLIRQLFTETLGSTLWSKFVSALNIVGFKRLESRIDPRKVNGAVFLGLNGIIVKSHGGTDPVGFSNAIDIAVELAKSDFEDELERTLTELHSEDDNIGFLP